MFITTLSNFIILIPLSFNNLDLKDTLLILEFAGAAANDERRKNYLKYAQTFLPLVHGYDLF